MSNPSKQKGTRFETDIANFLRATGFNSWRMAKTGHEYEGDIGGPREYVSGGRQHDRGDLAKKHHADVGAPDTQSRPAPAP